MWGRIYELFYWRQQLYLCIFEVNWVEDHQEGTQAEKAVRTVKHFVELWDRAHHLGDDILKWGGTKVFNIRLEVEGWLNLTARFDLEIFIESPSWCRYLRREFNLNRASMIKCDIFSSVVGGHRHHFACLLIIYFLNIVVAERWYWSILCQWV
jgi:hypothetical protein